MTGIQDVSGSTAVASASFELLTIASASATSELAVTGVVTGADYASIFLNARSYENLGLPVVDGSMDDGRIRTLILDVADALDSAAVERLRNRTAAERLQTAMVLLRLDDVDGGAEDSTAASAAFADAVAADASNPAFTHGTVTTSSTAEEIAVIRAATAADLAQAEADLATEQAEASPDTAVVDALAVTIAGLESEIDRLDGLSTLATAQETAESSFFTTVFDFFSALASFFLELFDGGEDDLGEAALENALREGGPIDQAMQGLAGSARKADQDRLAALIETVDRRALLESVRDEVRNARRDGRQDVDLGALVVQFAMRYTVEPSEGPAPSPIRVPDMRTAALESLRPGNNAPRRPNDPLASIPPREGGRTPPDQAPAPQPVRQTAPTDAVVRAPDDRPLPRTAEPVAARPAGGDRSAPVVDDEGRGILGFDMRDGNVVADPLLFDTLESGIFDDADITEALERIGREPFAAAERELPPGVDADALRRISASLAALIEAAIAVSDAVEAAARERSEAVQVEPRRVKFEL